MAFGRKTGGRTKGTRNKVTAEKALLVEATASGTLLAREVLERCMRKCDALDTKHA